MLRCFGAADAGLSWPAHHRRPGPSRPPVADAARALGVPAEEATSVSEAATEPCALAGPEELVHVTGSLYVVGRTRAWLHTGEL